MMQRPHWLAAYLFAMQVGVLILGLPFIALYEWWEKRRQFKLRSFTHDYKPGAFSSDPTSAAWDAETELRKRLGRRE